MQKIPHTGKFHRLFNKLDNVKTVLEVECETGVYPINKNKIIQL
jgi:hypothetical protein